MADERCLRATQGSGSGRGRRAWSWRSCRAPTWVTAAADDALRRALLVLRGWP
jgi:hypothetical protein